MPATTTDPDARTLRVRHVESIDAPAPTVWAVNRDVGRWPDLVEHFRAVDRLDRGELTVGSAARIEQTGLPSTVWTVTDVVDGEGFTWTSRFLGLDWTCGHHVGATSERTAELTLTVEVEGRAVRLLRPLLRRALPRAIEREAAAMRRVSEEA